MKYAILSDIHSNPVAFEQALEDARAHDVDKIICLGDVVGYGPDPARTVELVRKNCDVVLMGNHDAAVVGLESTDGYFGSAADGVRRNREQLSEEDRAWLKSLPARGSGREGGCESTERRDEAAMRNGFVIRGVKGGHGKRRFGIMRMVKSFRRALVISLCGWWTGMSLSTRRRGFTSSRNRASAFILFCRVRFGFEKERKIL